MFLTAVQGAFMVFVNEYLGTVEMLPSLKILISLAMSGAIIVYVYCVKEYYGISEVKALKEVDQLKQELKLKDVEMKGLEQAKDGAVLLAESYRLKTTNP